MSQGKKTAIRKDYDRTLTGLRKEHEDFLILDADLIGSTKTVVFHKAFPGCRINCGIAKRNMIDVTAGVAATGRVTFVNSFAMFATSRAYEQIRNSVDYPQLNVKIVTTHGGISVGGDGVTHQYSENFTLMRTIPGMVVMASSDDVEAEAMVRAVYTHKGPVYIHFSHLATSVFSNPETHRFGIGEAITMCEGKDVAIITAGLPAASAMEAAEKLAAEGTEARVIGMHTIKPLNEEAMLRAAKEIDRITTVEEHSVIGGLGSAVVEVLAEQCPAKLERVDVYDRYMEPGPTGALIHYYDLGGEGVYSAVKAFSA